MPKVFPAFPSYMQPKTSKGRRSPTIRQPLSTSMSECSDQPDMEIPAATAMPCPVASPSAPLKRKLESTENKLMASRKKIKTLLQVKRRLIKRTAVLKSVIAELRQQAIVSSSCVDVLQSCASGIPDLLKRQQSKALKQPLESKYSPELRSFALTLHFYSPRANSYVRKVFDTCLPHPRTISKWYQKCEDSPGFTKSAFDALKLRTEASGDRKTVCALLMDEMSIRKHVEFDGRTYHGYIDMRTELNEDSLPVAKDALVFMVVDLKSTWKLPVGYFLIDGLGGEERKNLVLACIEKLDAVGVYVASLTHDGCSLMLFMLQSLGIDWSDPRNVKSYFKHPVKDYNIFVLLDPCHMLKLVRNNLADKKSISSCGKLIKWDYLVALHHLQESEGLHLGNRLRSQHIAWLKKKMNVRLAAQTLSESVATSLEFCLRENFPEFEGCEETIKFRNGIRIFDKLFDVCNSRNLKSFGFKSPLQVSNYLVVFEFLSECSTYILNLHQANNALAQTIITSNRRTGFIGFLLRIQSIMSLFRELVLSNNYGMNFLLTYKLSQDHIELFFGKIRSMGGCNNNPTARQFKSAYKKILTHNDIQDVISGNCLALESVPILTASSTCLTDLNSVTPSTVVLNSSCSKNRVLLMDEDFVPLKLAKHSDDHDYTFMPGRVALSSCSHKIVAT